MSKQIGILTAKPTGAWKTPLMAYGACEYAFIYDPDKLIRDRYHEIGGFDPKLITQVTQSLRKYQYLCIARSGRYMCIVDKN